VRGGGVEGEARAVASTAWSSHLSLFRPFGMSFKSSSSLSEELASESLLT
jgi:hypothetical protein